MKEKLKLILDYKNTVRQLKEIVISTSNEELDFRPQNDYWTIREHIAHVLDCEIFGFTRYRKSIAEANSSVEGFNQDQWQSNLDYSIMDVFKSFQIIELLNEITTNHLMTILDKDWTNYFINHLERGKDNLETLIHRRITHLNEHIGYIKRNKSLFKNK